MKTTLLTCLCSLTLCLAVFGQTPSPTVPAPTPSPTPTATIAPSPTVAASISSADDDLDRAIKKKVRHHLGVTVGGHKDIDIGNGEDLGALMAIPIVGIIFTTLFGAPVLVVAAIMFFSYLKSRSLHRTVRMMVEKGQPVPEALFAPGTPRVRARSDMRRGIVLTMIGLGLIIFLAAVNGGFAGGEWAIGVIPLMIGAGYLLVWQLEGRKNGVPPLP